MNPHANRTSLISLLTFALLAAFACAQDDITEITSKITGVTVFTDRAEVTRSGTVTLAKGRRTVAFANLPDAVDPTSIQVNGSGGAILQEIRLERVHQAAAPDKELARLEERLQDLMDSARVVSDGKTHAEQEKRFVEKIAEGVTAPGGKEVPAELEPEKWVKMVSFYREKLDALGAQIRKAEQVERALAQETEKVRREIGELRYGSRWTNRIEVALEVKKAGEMRLNASYIVTGPSWSPLYEVRMASADRKLTVVYKAQVSQSTNEDWVNVPVRLSTARPQAGATHPELEPWYLRFYEPRPMASSLRMAKAAAPMEQMMDKELSYESVHKLEAEPEILSAPMEVAAATVETGATAVVFVPEGTSTVKSDNRPYTVTITEAVLSAELRYSAVPKLVQNAYLKAKAVNSTSYPFLAGPSTIFLDGAFVANGALETVAPTEEFWVFLGADEAVAVEHTLVKRYQKREGVIAKKECYVYEYLITVTNNRTSAEEVVVWDQVPISTNQEIVVDLVKPEYKADTKHLKKNEHNFLEWLLELKPGEKREIPFVFTVTYPRGKQVSGL